MKPIYQLLFTITIILLTSCAYETAGTDESNDMAANTRSQTTLVTTTRNALGSFAGNRLPNLQVSELEAGEYTLQFEIVEPTIDGLEEAVYAYINWKVAGQPMQRIISVFSGTAIGGVAEAVDVSLLDQSSRGNTFLNGFVTLINGSPNIVFTLAQNLAATETIVFSSQPNVTYGLDGPIRGTVGRLSSPYTGPGAFTTAVAFAQYKVACTLSKGTRPNTMQPPVLQTILTQTNGPGIQVLPIPRDAGVISTLVTSATDIAGPTSFLAINGLVQFVDPAGIVVGVFTPFTFPMWFPVPPSANRIQLVNTNTTQTLRFSIQWGIDG